MPIISRLSMRIACWAIVATFLLSVPANAAGFQSDVVFDRSSSLADNGEIARRMLDALALAKLTAEAGHALRGQAVDLAQEKFSLYVPAQMPPDGYGLFVFVAPWDDARLPSGWASVLDRLGMIFVS